MRFKSVDDTFSNIVTMDIWWGYLEIAVPLINDGAALIGASLIVEDLDINTVALGFEVQHDDVVGSNAMAVVS